MSLGSPFAADTRANNSWRLYEWITDQPLDQIPPERLAEVRSTPPVPTTSIFSRTDGVCAWQSSLQMEEERAEMVRLNMLAERERLMNGNGGQGGGGGAGGSAGGVGGVEGMPILPKGTGEMSTMLALV